MRGWDGELPPPATRTLAEMQTVLYQSSCRCEDPLYFMYRNLAMSDTDRRWLYSHNLRYDLTMIPPRDLCGEWAKTKGHYHPENPAGVGYPEVYEVMEGHAHYLLQAQALDDIVLIDARAGDFALIPPGYGHITINPEKDRTLVMANIVSTVFESEYASYECLHGAAYYELTNGEFLKNPHYPEVPAVRNIRPECRYDGLPGMEGPLYSLIGNERALDFLNRPERYGNVFKALLRG